jgi:hypothetical protein
MDMDLVSTFTGMQQAKLASQVQYAVAGKVLDQQRSEGAAAVQLIEAATAGANRAGDQLVAAATGLGGTLDVRA